MKTIGSSSHPASDILRQFGLGPFRKILSSGAFERVAQQAECAPKRKRPLIPEVVAWLMMFVAMQNTSMTQGLIRAWGLVRSLCPGLDRKAVSEEAFSQGRSGLRLRFWRILWHHVQTQYEQRFDAVQRWKKKYRVLAVDGTEVILPHIEALIRFFGQPSGAKKGRKPQARLVAISSVFTGFCLTFKLAALRFSEHTVFRHLRKVLQPNDLLLADRGFFSLRSNLGHPLPWGGLSHAHLPSGGRIRSSDTVFGGRGMADTVSSDSRDPAEDSGLACRINRSPHPLSKTGISLQLPVDLPHEYQDLHTQRVDRALP